MLGRIYHCRFTRSDCLYSLLVSRTSESLADLVSLDLNNLKLLIDIHEQGSLSSRWLWVCGHRELLFTQFIRCLSRTTACPWPMTSVLTWSVFNIIRILPKINKKPAFYAPSITLHEIWIIACPSVAPQPSVWCLFQGGIIQEAWPVAR